MNSSRKNNDGEYTVKQVNARSLFSLLLWVGFTTLMACSGRSSLECGEGTVEKDGYCVPALRCGEDTFAQRGQCVTADFLCAPVCDDAECGDDGCGGSCGACEDEAAPYCVAGACVAECTPSCGERTCGPDGCGGSCGECGDGEKCSVGAGACISADWTCDGSLYQDGTICDCECGIADPDCDTSSQVRGCDLLLAACTSDNVCEGGFEASEWTCPIASFRDGVECNCGCGIPDPDCEIETNPVIGCGGNACNPDGTCAECVPQCDGRECGLDGCGGFCGECTEEGKFFCNDGICGAQCEPRCDGKTCGPDGCGGECGVCANGQVCQAGNCGAPPADASCQDNCGGVAASGCSCEPGCDVLGTCCADVVQQCGCQPYCDGKSCGDDGCGGSCGTCAQGLTCDEQGQCVDNLCDPDPCNGNGTCDSSDGSCTCLAKYGGVNCDECAPGRVDYPNCTEDQCTVFSCNQHGVCDSVSGSCDCFGGYTGTECDACEPGKGTYPNCMP